jgi:hypothetical protein
MTAIEKRIRDSFSIHYFDSLLVKEYGVFASGYSASLDALDSTKMSKEFVTFCNKAKLSPVCKGILSNSFCDSL